MRKKFPSVPYTRVSAALEEYSSGLDEKQAKHLCDLIDKAAKEAKDSVMKSIK